MYYVLQCHEPDDPSAPIVARFSDLDDSELDWFQGQPFEEPPAYPIPVSTMGGELPDLSEVPVPLMSRRLAAALGRAGVDNIDFYPAEILYEPTGARLDSHLAFNLIGLVAAADLAASRYDAPEGPLISVDFESLAIDDAKTGGALMFRLAECVTCIIVHESVRNIVEAEGIDTLDFLDPKNWIG